MSRRPPRSAQPPGAAGRSSRSTSRPASPSARARSRAGTSAACPRPPSATHGRSGGDGLSGAAPHLGRPRPHRQGLSLLRGSPRSAMPWVAGKAPAVRPARPACPQADAAERLMAEAPALLSAGTHMTGMLLAPPLKHTALDRIELVPLGEDRALAVLVTDTGWVTARPINTVPRGGDARSCARSAGRSPGASAARRSRQILDDLAAPADPLDPLWTRSAGAARQVVALLRDAHALRERGHQHARSPGPLGRRHAAAAAARLRGQGAPDRPALPDGRGARRPGHDRQREPDGGHARAAA